MLLDQNILNKQLLVWILIREVFLDLIGLVFS